MAIDQEYKERRVNNLPTSGLSAGDKYALNVGGGKYQTYIVSDTLQLVKEAGAEFIEKDTMAEMTALSAREIWALQNGYYKGVKLNGLDVKGDITSSLIYYITSNSAVVDGKVVVQVGDIKIKAEFYNLIDGLPNNISLLESTDLHKTRYVRTIYEFMPKEVIDDVYGDCVLDHTPYLQMAIDAIGTGGVLQIPLIKWSAMINISSTININSANRSIKIIGTRGTGVRSASNPTFKWIGDEDGGIMFDIFQSWGITFEDCSFDGRYEASSLIRIRADNSGSSILSSHMFSFNRCSFQNTYNDLIIIGDGGNEDVINVKFNVCQFYYGSTARVSDDYTGITIDCPEGYCLDFSNCFFLRTTYPKTFFNIISGSVSMNSVTFDGSQDTLDIFINPQSNLALSPQLTIVHGESQSDMFLATNSGVVTYPTRGVTLIGVRHRADNGTTNAKSIYWDLGHQSQLVHISSSLLEIEIGSNAVSVVEVAPQWGKLGTSISEIKGYSGNVDVVTGLNGYNITASDRTARGGIRVGQEFITFGKATAGGLPSNLTGVKRNGDFWINNKDSVESSSSHLYKFETPTEIVAIGDGVSHRNATRTVIPSATPSKFTYRLTTNITPQINSVYEVRWTICANKTSNIYESGVMHVYIMTNNTLATISSKSVTSSQQEPPLITPSVVYYNPNTTNESTGATANQTALNNFKIRVKLDGADVDTLFSSESKITIRRILH